MSLIRVLSLLMIAATLALLAKSYFAKEDPLAANYDLCIDLDADRVVVLAACSAVYAAEWLPNHVRGLVLKFRAHAFKNEEDYDAAVQDLNQAIILRPRDGNAHSMRAWVWARLHNYDNTLRDLERLEQLQDLDVSNMRLRAWAYIKLDKIELAEAHYERAVRLDPENLETFRWWNRRMSAVDRPELAIRACQKLLQETPEADEHPCKPKVREALESYQKAVKFIRDMREEMLRAQVDLPVYAQAQYYSLLGFSYFQLGYDKQTLLTTFKHWHNTGRHTPFPALFIAATLFRFAEIEDGKRYAREAAQDLVGDAQARSTEDWKVLENSFDAQQLDAAANMYFTAIAYAKIREYDLSEAAFQTFLKAGGEPAKEVLAALLKAHGLVPSNGDDLEDAKDLQIGLERFMVHQGQLLSPDGAEFARVTK